MPPVWTLIPQRFATVVSTRVSLSKKTLRIDVDRNPDPAARFRRGGQHGAQETLQIGRARRLGGKPEPMAFAHDRNRRLGRSEQDNFVLLALPAERRAAPVFGPG